MPIDVSIGDLVSADLDLDGYPDLVVGGSAVPDGLLLAWNQGDGSFGDVVVFRGPVGPDAVEVEDLDGDGLPDLVMTPHLIFRNAGGRRMEQHSKYLSNAESPEDFVLLDIEGDGDKDIVTASRLSLKLDLVKNVSLPAIASDENGDGILDECESGSQLAGDCTQDGTVNISDGICILNTLFRGKPPRLPCGDGHKSHESNIALLDWQPDGLVDMSDAVLLVQSLYMGGPAAGLSAEADENGCVPILGCDDNLGCAE